VSPVDVPEVGTELPPLRRTITLVDMVAYAGATWDWHRLHYDLAYLTEHGLTAPVVDGQVLGALLAEQAQDAFGSRAFVRSLHFRLKNLVYAGETVRCTAHITAVTALDHGHVLLTLAVSVDVVGDRPRPALDQAGLEVVLR
jgi:acyl dehydratase